MRTLEASNLGRMVESLCVEVSTTLPEDVSEALARSREKEESSAGREVIDLILENARAASELGIPLCQDTGVFTVFLTLGQDTCLSGDFEAQASAAVSNATGKAALRSSVVRDPLSSRVNTKDNTPPLVEVEIAGGKESSLAVMAKGGGCENASRLAMLPPGAGWNGVLEFVVGVVEQVGAFSCPPLVLGVGIGGSFDRAPHLAKRALLRPLDSDNGDPPVGSQENELVNAVNLLGIGPGALGGTLTCIGARIEQEPCHMATLPVALSVNCHALRRKVVMI